MSLEVHVVTPERQLWSGQAQIVVAHGVDGDVGILSGHAPLLVQLAIAPLRIRLLDDEEVVLAVDGGFMHVTSGEEGTRVDVMATGGELASEVDAEALRRRAEELRELGETGTEAEVEARRTELQQAKARMDLVG